MAESRKEGKPPTPLEQDVQELRERVTTIETDVKWIKFTRNIVITFLVVVVGSVIGRWLIP